MWSRTCDGPLCLPIWSGAWRRRLFFTLAIKNMDTMVKKIVLKSSESSKCTNFKHNLYFFIFFLTQGTTWPSCSCSILYSKGAKLGPAIAFFFSNHAKTTGFLSNPFGDLQLLVRLVLAYH